MSKNSPHLPRFSGKEGAKVQRFILLSKCLGKFFVEKRKNVHAISEIDKVSQ